MKNFAHSIVAVFLISLIFSGCGIVSKSRYESDVKGLHTRVGTLESKVEGVELKQTEAERLAFERAQAAEEAKMAVPRTNIVPREKIGKSKARVKEIQTCLANAGFYKGAVDGIKGKKTRRPIKEFQEANGLTPDGVVGPKTWALLSGHSTGSGSVEEVSKIK